MLRTRVLTAIAMVAALYLGTAYLPPFYFGLALALVLLPALREWTRLMGLASAPHKLLYMLLFYVGLLLTAWWLGLHPQAQALQQQAVLLLMLGGLAFWLLALILILAYPANHLAWAGRLRIGLMGFACMLPTWVGLLQLKYIADSGYLVLALIALVSVADIGAYFVGRRWGRAKLAPKLSPKKSWAGFWGGVAACALLGLVLTGLLHGLLTPLPLWLMATLVLAAALVAVIGAVGDLFESMLKREQGIKDSGSSLPGHGGLLDRTDSLLAATPPFVLVMMYLLPDVLWV